MTENEPFPQRTARRRNNSVRADDGERAKSASAQKTASEKAFSAGKEDMRTGAGAAQDPAAPSRTATDKQMLAVDDVPQSVRKRYYVGKSKWSGEPVYFTTAQAKDPAFRDQGRRLITATESQEVVKDLVAIAQHRGWARVHVTGSDAFRQSIWLEARQKGLEVRGYKPNDRDLQLLDRLRGESSRNTIAPMVRRGGEDPCAPTGAQRQADAARGNQPDAKHAGHRVTPNDRAAASQMRVMEAVVRRALFSSPEAVARVMTVARAQLDAHIAAGRTIRPAMVRDVSPMVRQDVSMGPEPPRPAMPRPGREPTPHDRGRSR